MFKSTNQCIACIKATPTTDMQLDLEQMCESRVQCTSCKRCEEQENVKEPKQSLKRSQPWSEQEIVKEAKRCLYCGVPGCVLGCPTSLNCKQMVHACAVQDYYYGAKLALSANPMALSCAQLCECDEGTCQSCCCLSQTQAGAIKTGEIQHFVMNEFFKYGIKAKVPTHVAKIEKSVAIIGAGPAGLSAATFLRRLGFQKVVIYEKEDFAGGLLMSQITEDRLSAEDVQKEVQLVKDLGVEFIFNKEIKKEDEIHTKYDFVLVAAGKQQTIDLGVKYNQEDMTVYSSAEFLSTICKKEKLHKEVTLPDLNKKKVIVLGAGNTAIDCCFAAQRLGANVTLAFRKQFSDIRAAKGQVNELMRSGVSLQQLSQLEKIEKGKAIFDIQKKEDGKYTSTQQKLWLDADVIISAYGTKKVEISHAHENILSIGDYSDSISVVEAVNDGKTAAAELYKKVTGKELKSMPEFWSEVDEVDISVDVNGVHYRNPFLISSSPTSLTYEHCRRALEAGWGGVVVKTAVLTKDVHVENCLRIFKINNNPGDNTYGNNCMVSDHPHDYWVKSIKQLRLDFPDRVIVASIMCSDVKEDWEQLAKLMEEAGAHALELNFSCPNQCAAEGDLDSFADKDKLMAMAIGQVPEALERCTRYVTNAVKIPVYAKLTPNHYQGELDVYAQAALRGGAAGVAYSNTISNLAKVFPNGYPYPQVGTKRISLPSNGYSGSAIRPIVLAGICKIRSALKPEQLSILGIGGIESADTAMQFIHAGAQALQVCSAVMTWSYEIVEEMKCGMQFLLYCNSTPRLRAYLESFGEQKLMPHYQGDWTQLSSDKDSKVPTLAERCNLVQTKLLNRESMEHVFQWNCKAQIDQNICINCGTCASTCRDNAGHAFVYENKTFKVNPDWCVGCMLCATVCPVGAIKMVQCETQPKYVYHPDANFWKHE